MTKNAIVEAQRFEMPYGRIIIFRRQNSKARGKIYRSPTRASWQRTVAVVTRLARLDEWSLYPFYTLTGWFVLHVPKRESPE